ncbi:MAG: ankyrin repeat domain-containing protein [Desulfobacterales bacterium]|jgi:ankyrin repeat protein
MLSIGKRWKSILFYIYIIICSLSSLALAEGLHEAVKEENLDKLKRLIEEGANIEARDASAATPLYLAVDRGYKDLVKLLISKGANVNAVDKNGNTPLWWAEFGGFKELMELLVKHGGHK